MKKPKKKQVKPPKDSLIIDYGRTRVIMPYRVSLIEYYEAELLLIDKWCEQTFKLDTWRRGGLFPGYIYFIKASDATMFLLRWGR